MSSQFENPSCLITQDGIIPIPTPGGGHESPPLGGEEAETIKTIVVIECYMAANRTFEEAYA